MFAVGEEDHFPSWYLTLMNAETLILSAYAMVLAQLNTKAENKKGFFELQSLVIRK